MGKKMEMFIEFMMVYGWAILVVIGAIGALAYFGVFNPQNLFPVDCEQFCTERNYSGCAWEEFGLTMQRFACHDSDGDEVVYDKRTKEIKEIKIFMNLSLSYNETENQTDLG